MIGWLLLPLLLVLLLMGAVAVLNFLTLPRLQPGATQQQPRVSILVPARNEAAQIGQTVSALMAQAYPHFEVIVLDDHSEDETAALAQSAGGGQPHFRLLTGTPLPTGWGGKNWACHQLAQAARYDLLLFTDADVQWQPQALAAVVARQQQEEADLLTVWPTQITVTWGERLVVPLMAFALLAYLPVQLAHHSPYPLAAAANGQCMLFRRSAYRACGGHAAICGQVLDDVLLARRVKAVGGRLRMADGAGLMQCRMYDSWSTAFYGYTKNILAGHGNSPWLLGFSTLLHLALFVLPWGLLVQGLLGDGGAAGWPWWPVALIGAGLGVRVLTAFTTRQRLRDALWMPLSVLLMTCIAGQALWWHWRKEQAQWKGRRLPV
ncbi:MAG: glycosyltransferase [Caldilineaceae bacterium]